MEYQFDEDDRLIQNNNIQRSDDSIRIFYFFCIYHCFIQKFGLLKSESELFY